jgi:outer membrane protein assembly factor BamD (BamD/ComL family)
MVMTVALVIGCQTFGGRSDSSVSSYAADDIDPEVGVPLERDETVMARTKKSTNKFVGFITGREPENLARAKELYVQGDAAFREASAMPRGESSKQFMTASKLFRRAQQAAPKTAVQQDAMFMEGESLFFADQLMDASKVYEKLQKEFPRNRHNDKVAARLFAISRYWIETKKVDEQRWTMPVNFTDDTRPAFDVDGHAIRVLDQIRYDDPTGRLADDATMAAAAEHIRQEKFEEADEFLTDLREAFPDSDHLFLAHLLGIRCKLNVYQGPAYSGLVLDEADKLVKQTRTRFPDRLQDPKYRDMVARASAEISYLRAEHLMGRAEYREKRREYRSAQYYYRLILTEHSETPFAEIARDRLKETESLPPVPEQRLAWLTKVFPDSRSGKPLQLNTSVTPAESQEAAPNTETKLR